MIRQTQSYQTLHMISFVCFMVMPVFALVWFAGFMLSRLHMFQHEYNKLTHEHKNNEWLLRQCEHDQFYHSLRHHSTLCDEVAALANDSIVLHAAQRVVRETYLCGYEPCSAVLDHLLQWVLGSGFMVSIGVMVVLLFIPTCLVPMFRHQYLVHNKNANMLAIHDPYGRYIDSYDLKEA